MMISRELAKNTNFSHYRIVSKIGVGGMGEVYLAVDTQLERKVAVKFLKEEFSQNTDKLNRFIREAKAISALNHPNILTVFEIGEIDGRNFIATEFIDGKTLRERLIKRELPNLSAVLNISIQVVEALAAAHQAGIVHRDIKPENIMIRQDGYAKVLDFGLAKLLERKDEKSGSEDDESTLIHSPHLMVSPSLYYTNPGMVLGTVSYMSPEQARGKETDGRTDIWSLGVVLYEMLSGRLPFTGETTNHTIVAILEKEPSMLEGVPDELQRIVRKALTKDKDMRYQTARDFLIDLKNLRRDLDIQGELERSASPNRSDASYSFHDSATHAYVKKSTEETHGDPAAQARTTVRLDVGGLPSWVKALAVLLIPIILASAAWWFFGRPERAALNTGLLKSVGIANWSSGPNELSVEASFSPDAKMIAFGSARSGATEIWIKPVAGGEAIQVTKNGFYSQYPVWSPNGQEIAFFSNRGGKRGIWRTSFTGGEQTEVSADFEGTAKLSHWSASGKIYFQSGSDLFSTDDKSGETKRLTDFQTRALQPRHIEISKDESKIAYAVKENDLFKIKTKRLDAESSVEVAASKDQIDYLAWHPNGSDVIYSATVEGTYQIFKVSEDGGAPTQLSTGDFDFLVEDVSRDGEKILYWTQNETSDLWKVNLQDGRESLIADDTSSEYWAGVSPDGKSVAYQSVAKANRPFSGSVNVKSLADAASPLTVSANGFSPVWSNDGKWIAFFKRSEKEVEIWRVESSGGNARRLTSGVQSMGYSAVPYLKIGTNLLTFPPGGNNVAYAARRDGKSNIWLVSADGTTDKQLTKNEDQAEWFCCPIWTPDGSRFVVSSNYTTSEPNRRSVNRLWLHAGEDSAGKAIFETANRIRLLGIAGNDAVIAVAPETNASTPTSDVVYIETVSLKTGVNSRINTLNNTYFHNVHLSPDGKMIAYVIRNGNVSEVWVAPLKGGAPRKAAADNNPKVYLSSLSWSPDGKSIFFGKQTQNSVLSMLTN